MRHNARCAIFQEPPTLRDDSDCNCGAIPSLRPLCSLEQAITQLSMRKQNLDHILETSERTKELRIREDELDHVLELLGAFTS